MKKLIVLGLALLLCFISCAKERHYVRTGKPPTKKVIILPEKIDPSFRPYVVNGQRYYPLPDSEGFVQFGKASWYGKKFHGRLTASGERFDMYKKSAAHKTLPLGTHVKVTNLSNKRQAILRINDRGPFVKGRVIDLSYAAAKDLGLIGPGVSDVRIVALAREVGSFKSPQGLKPVVEFVDLKKGEFTVQVGAFKNKDNALRLADRLKVIFSYVDTMAYDDKDKGMLYRVQVSKSKTLNQAGEIEKRLEGMGFEEAFIVSL
jgi:rare lipoprotein A